MANINVGNIQCRETLKILEYSDDDLKSSSFFLFTTCCVRYLINQRVETGIYKMYSLFFQNWPKTIRIFSWCQVKHYLCSVKTYQNIFLAIYLRCNYIYSRYSTTPSYCRASPDIIRTEGFCCSSGPTILWAGNYRTTQESNCSYLALSRFLF